MNDFETALVSPGKNSLIPEKDNWFGPLVGTWDIEWVDGHGTEHERHVKGEWIFSWVLEGMAVQDVFICLPGRPGISKPGRTPPTARRSEFTIPATDMGHFLRCGRRSHAAGSEKGRQPDCPDGNYRAKDEMDFFRTYGKYVPLEKHGHGGRDALVPPGGSIRRQTYLEHACSSAWQATRRLSPFCTLPGPFKGVFPAFIPVQQIKQPGLNNEPCLPMPARHP